MDNQKIQWEKLLSELSQYSSASSYVGGLCNVAKTTLRNWEHLNAWERYVTADFLFDAVDLTDRNFNRGLGNSLIDRIFFRKLTKERLESFDSYMEALAGFFTTLNELVEKRLGLETFGNS